MLPGLLLPTLVIGGEEPSCKAHVDRVDRVKEVMVSAFPIEQHGLFSVGLLASSSGNSEMIACLLHSVSFHGIRRGQPNLFCVQCKDV